MYCSLLYSLPCSFLCYIDILCDSLAIGNRVYAHIIFFAIIPTHIIQIIIISQVTDHCAIDLDQAAIETQLALKTSESFEQARRIYNEGGNSKSYAQISLTTPLSKSIQKGDSIMGRNTAGIEVAGKSYADYPSGTQTINVLYETTDVQSSYMECQVGGLASTSNLDGCFEKDGTFNIDGDEYAYTYTPESDNKNDRTM